MMTQTPFAALIGWPELVAVFGLLLVLALIVAAVLGILRLTHRATSKQHSTSPPPLPDQDSLKTRYRPRLRTYGVATAMALGLPFALVPLFRTGLLPQSLDTSLFLLSAACLGACSILFAYCLARAKGYDSGWAGLLSILCPPFCIVIVCLLPDKSSRH